MEAVREKNIGSSFESWLDEEGIRAEVDARVRERLLDARARSKKGSRGWETLPRAASYRPVMT